MVQVHADEPRKFLLSVSGQPQLSSTAELTNRGILIEDAQGIRTMYRRFPRADSPDDEYLGYYSQANNLLLRFPRTGRGAMFTSDATVIRWTPTRMRAEPIGGVVTRKQTVDVVTSAIQVNPDGSIQVATARTPVTVRETEVQEGLIDSHIDEVPMPPVDVEFQNSFGDEILLILNGGGDAKSKIEYKVSRDGKISKTFRVPPQFVLVKSYLVRDPLTDQATERLVRELLPRTANVRISVYENSVRSRYYDSTKRGRSKLISETRSLRSVGSFVLDLAALSSQDGPVEVDAYREAVRQQNPGFVDRPASETQ
jgi:hypothetical protein